MGQFCFSVLSPSGGPPDRLMPLVTEGKFGPVFSRGLDPWRVENNEVILCIRYGTEQVAGFFVPPKIQITQPGLC